MKLTDKIIGYLIKNFGYEASFNINNNVKIQLTEEGIAHLKREHDKLFAMYGVSKPSFRTPEVDADGWSKFQMHEVMFNFGSLTYNGSNKIPFYTGIKIIHDRPVRWKWIIFKYRIAKLFGRAPETISLH
jgi:hypothetical protein